MSYGKRFVSIKRVIDIAEQMYEVGYVIIPQVISENEIKVILEHYYAFVAHTGLTTLRPSEFLSHPEIFNVLLKHKITKAIRELFKHGFSFKPDFTISDGVSPPWKNNESPLDDVVPKYPYPLPVIQCAIYLLDSCAANRIDRAGVSSKHNEPSRITASHTIIGAGDLLLWNEQIQQTVCPGAMPDSQVPALRWAIKALENCSNLRTDTLQFQTSKLH